MSGETKTVEFHAEISPTQSGFRTGADGFRVQLDIPESDATSALWLVAMKQKELLVTVSCNMVGKGMAVPDAHPEDRRGKKAQTASQKLRWAIMDNAPAETDQEAYYQKAMAMLWQLTMDCNEKNVRITEVVKELL